jgi:predicted O-methyltransferase YrrM
MVPQTPQETSIADWARVDNYFESFLTPNDLILDAVVDNNDERGLPDIAVSPAQGKFLNLLLRSIGAKRVLEIGTLGGYVFNMWDSFG